MRIIGDGGHAKVVRDILKKDGFLGTFIAVGDNAARKREAESNTGDFFPSIVADSAYVSPLASVGDGTVVMRNAIVAAGAKVGRFCIVNHGATVDHDCVIGDYAHIGPGAHLCGHVEVGEGSLVGVGVGIAPGCKVPAWSLVKARRLEIVTLQGN